MKTQAVFFRGLFYPQQDPQQYQSAHLYQQLCPPGKQVVSPAQGGSLL